MRRWAPEYMVHPFFKKNGTLVVSLPTRVRYDGSRSARAGKVSPVLAEGSARWHERVYICGSTREMCLFRVVLRLVFITGERFEPWAIAPDLHAASARRVCVPRRSQQGLRRVRGVRQLSGLLAPGMPKFRH